MKLERVTLKSILERIAKEEEVVSTFEHEVCGGWTWYLSQSAYVEDGTFSLALISNNGEQYVQINDVKARDCNVPSGTSGSWWLEFNNGEVNLPIDGWHLEEDE